MVDYSQFVKKADQPEVSELHKPRRIFLVLAFIFTLGAAFAYLYEDSLPSASSANSNTGFLMLLVGCVLLSVFMVLCYRVPRIGNKLLGYGIYEKPKDKFTEGYHYSAGFSTESAVDEKRMNSKRIKTRSQRKKYAKATREMQENPSVTTEE